MLHVQKSFWFPQTINQSQVVKVARSAKEDARSGRTTISLNPMGPCERAYDVLLCRNVKKTAYQHIDGMSYFDSQFNMIMDTPPHERNQNELVKTLENIDSHQIGLSELMPGKTLEYGSRTTEDTGREGPIVTDERESYLIYRDSSKQQVLGVPLYSPAERGEPTTIGTGETDIPTYQGPDSIDIDGLQLIQTAGKVGMATTMYRVRLHGTLQEPIVVYDQDDGTGLELQKRLSKLWAREQISIQQRRFTEMTKDAGRVRLVAPQQIIEEVEPVEDSQTAEKPKSDDQWRCLVTSATQNLSDVAATLPGCFQRETDAIGKQFNVLQKVINSPTELRTGLLELSRRVDQLVDKQNRVNATIQRLRQTYTQIFELSFKWKNLRIRKELFNRITKINSHITDLIRINNHMGIVDSADIYLRYQLTFLQGCTPARVARVDDLTRQYTQRLSPNLQQEVKPKAETMLGALANPYAEWDVVDDVMNGLHLELSKLFHQLASQAELSAQISSRLDLLPDQVKQVLNSKTGETPLTSAAFSRVVSICETRDILKSKNKIYTDVERSEMMDEVAEHFVAVEREIDKLSSHNSGTSLLRRAMQAKQPMYSPATNNGKHANFEDWEKLQKCHSLPTKQDQPRIQEPTSKPVIDKQPVTFKSRPIGITAPPHIVPAQLPMQVSASI